jgi:hypothetical protein
LLCFLLVADTMNNRVLFFSPGNTTASRVYGQSDFSSNLYGCSATMMRQPSGVAVDTNNNLYGQQQTQCEVVSSQALMKFSIYVVSVACFSILVFLCQWQIARLIACFFSHPATRLLVKFGDKQVSPLALRTPAWEVQSALLHCSTRTASHWTLVIIFMFPTQAIAAWFVK